MKKIICLVLFLNLSQLLKAQQDSLLVKTDSLPVSTLSIDSFKIKGKPILGKAGMYSSKADGTQTASGQKVNNANFTGAFNQFKLNTWVKVTNLANKKYALVRITDRTSKKKGAPIIELTRAAAGKLGFLKTGITKVKVEEIVVINSKLYDSVVEFEIVKEPVQAVPDKLIPDSFKITGKAVTGIASFYSANLDGTQTATGERYRNAKFTAASNNFKLNTWVLVTNLRNKNTVIVRINDRMHPRMKRKGRVVDLSGIAARQLDFIENGLTKVKVEEIKWIERADIVIPDTLKPVKDTLAVIQLDSIPVVPKDSTIADTLKKEDGILYGIASFYSTNLDGTKTATGEIYRNSKLSAASNDFKLNTWVRVTNLKNNKSIILRINDRMHPKMQQKGRVVDLSRIAAKRLNFLKNGLAKVKVEAVAKGTRR